MVGREIVYHADILPVGWQGISGRVAQFPFARALHYGLMFEIDTICQIMLADGGVTAQPESENTYLQTVAGMFVVSSHT